MVTYFDRKRKSSQPAETAPQKRARRSNATLDALQNAPDAIYKAQTEFNLADRPYQRRLAEIGIEALSLPVFTGKDGAPRAAANDTERDRAYALLLVTDEALLALTDAREVAVAKLALAKNRFDAALRSTRLLAVREPR